MKAAYITQTGDPDVIQFGDLPDPDPAAGQVLVRVEAVAVNPIDAYVRGGLVALELDFPYTIGCDLAGTIVACGEGVERFAVGDRVWGSNQGLMGRAGTFSELAAVDEQWLYAAPEGVSSEVLAAGALVGLTAHLGLFRQRRNRWRGCCGGAIGQVGRCSCCRDGGVVGETGTLQCAGCGSRR